MLQSAIQLRSSRNKLDSLSKLRLLPCYTSKTKLQPQYKRLQIWADHYMPASVCFHKKNISPNNQYFSNRRSVSLLLLLKGYHDISGWHNLPGWEGGVQFPLPAANPPVASCDSCHSCHPWGCPVSPPCAVSHLVTGGRPQSLPLVPNTLGVGQLLTQTKTKTIITLKVGWGTWLLRTMQNHTIPCNTTTQQCAGLCSQNAVFNDAFVYIASVVQNVLYGKQYISLCILPF